MKVGSLLGWGIVIYAITYLEWSGFVVYSFTGGFAPRICLFLTIVTISVIAGRSLRYRTWKDVLPYSLGWVAVVAGLDAVFSVPFGGWSFYLNWSLWTGYALVAIAPLFSPYTRVDQAGGPWLS